MKVFFFGRVRLNKLKKKIKIPAPEEEEEEEEEEENTEDEKENFLKLEEELEKLENEPEPQINETTPESWEDILNSDPDFDMKTLQKVKGQLPPKEEFMPEEDFQVQKKAPKIERIRAELYEEGLKKLIDNFIEHHSEKIDVEKIEDPVEKNRLIQISMKNAISKEEEKLNISKKVKDRFLKFEERAPQAYANLSHPTFADEAVKSSKTKFPQRADLNKELHSLFDSIDKNKK